MKVKKMVKRLFAVGTGVAMLGATAMGALAADLKDYPSMFVSDGKFNGLLVVGEKASPIDNLAMTDIAANMKYHKGTGTTVASVSGDAWRVGTSSQKLEMAGNVVSQSSIKGESLYDIQTFITKDELAGLKSGTYSTGQGTYNFEQYLYFDVANNDANEVVLYGTDSNSDKTAEYLFFKSGANIGQYKLELTSNAQSAIQDTAGSTCTSGAVLKDYENTKLTMFGKEYTVVLARRPSAKPQGSIKLTLMGGSAGGSLLEGESTTVTANDKTYDVVLTYVDTTYAKFTVNGQASGKMQKGDTFKLADGNEIGVSEVLYQSYAGGIHSSDFFVGASKVIMQDNVITDSNSSNGLVIGSDTISGADVIIEGTDDNTTFSLSRITVNMTADSDYYVPTGKKLSEVIGENNDRKEMLFTNNWDIQNNGLTEEKAHDLKLSAGSDTKYRLHWWDGDNNPVDMPLAYANAATTVQLSEDGSKMLVLNENTTVSKNDYFVVTGGSSSAGSAKSYLLQYKGSDKSSASSPKIRFKNLGSGENLEYAVAGSNPEATIKLGGYSFKVNNVTADSADDFGIQVDLNGDSTLTAGFNNGNSTIVSIVDYYGGTLAVGQSGSDNGSAYNFSKGGSLKGFNLTVTTDNSNDYDNRAPSQMNLNISAASTKVTVSQLIINGTTNPLITPSGESNVAYGYTTLGGKLTYTTPSSSPQELTYAYPEHQRLPQVFITTGAVSSSSSSAADLAAVEIGVATKLDSEVADAWAQNLIVVGGPCVNSVAAELMGNPASCAEGFTPGKAVVKLFEKSGKVAMLVAGYSGADTRLAGKVVAQQASKLMGMEVEIEGTSLSDVKVGAPTVVTKSTAAAEPAAPATK